MKNMMREPDFEQLVDKISEDYKKKSKKLLNSEENRKDTFRIQDIGMANR